MRRGLLAIVLVLTSCGGLVADEPTGTVSAAPPPECDPETGVVLVIGDAPPVALRFGRSRGLCSGELPCLSSLCGRVAFHACAAPRGGAPCISVERRSGVYVDRDGVERSLSSVILEADVARSGDGWFRGVDSRGVEVSGTFASCAVSHASGCE